ncbi:hypothetical protein COLO4_10941 [Corchorus olitorius]|uniref:Uncharacterized protein n=1 Tax=Corchorus olitorius TaxID=93759 RepID=A0A1R3K6F0_9ROSI|nr:hypothetical protein COLO4_10941 [Corchorus olitorius]
MVGCFGNLYESIENLCDTYIQPTATKDSLLNPKVSLLPTIQYQKSANRAETSSSDGGGYVKGAVTYMVMDDLVVWPRSTISGITLINKFNIKDIRVLEERVIDMGMDQGGKLIQAALLSKTVLTDVFLGKKVSK